MVLKCRPSWDSKDTRSTRASRWSDLDQPLGCSTQSYDTAAGSDAHRAIGQDYGGYPHCDDEGSQHDTRDAAQSTAKTLVFNLGQCWDRDIRSCPLLQRQHVGCWPCWCKEGWIITVDVVGCCKSRHVLHDRSWERQRVATRQSGLILMARTVRDGALPYMSMQSKARQSGNNPRV